NDDSLIVALRQPENVGHLPVETAGSVQDQNTDITMFNGPYRAHHRIEFQIFLDLCLSTDPRRVHQVELKSKLVVSGIYAVAGGPGNIGDNIAVFPHQGI